MRLDIYYDRNYYDSETKNVLRKINFMMETETTLKLCHELTSLSLVFTGA